MGAHAVFGGARPAAIVGEVAQADLGSGWLAREDLQDEGAGGTKKQIYLVTLPHPRLVGDSGWRCTTTMSHEEVLRMFSDSVRHPAYVDAASAFRNETTVQAEKMVVFKEMHEPDEHGTSHPHFHIALQLSNPRGFATFKRALALHHRVASHWSCSHTGYWSAVRYGFFPTARKPQDALDPQPLVWCREGEHPTLFDCSQEPLTAAALRKRRENKVLGASAASKPEPRAGELDIYAVIVQHGFRNTDENPWAHKQLIEHLQRHGSPKVVELAWKMRHRLKQFIDDVWLWEEVGKDMKFLTLPRWDVLLHAFHSQCVCGGSWRECAEWALQANGIDAKEICTYLCHSLREGRSETAPVVTLMGRGGGEGKSFLLSPLPFMFGRQYTQRSPQPGNFPLLGLDEKRIAVLDDWDFNPDVLPFSAQLLWYEGKDFPINRPQNDKDAKGHLIYGGKAPIFITTKEKHLGRIIETASKELEAGVASECSMLLRRLKVFAFHVKLPLDATRLHCLEAGFKIPPCCACFAKMLFFHANRAE